VHSYCNNYSYSKSDALVWTLGLFEYGGWVLEYISYKNIKAFQLVSSSRGRRMYVSRRSIASANLSSNGHDYCYCW